MVENNWKDGCGSDNQGSELLFFFILLVIIFCSCGNGRGFGKF
ncbi:MAG: hypothetical protein WDA24_10340 [Tissierellales bacterium]